MRIIQDFTEKGLREVLNDFYSYFKTGFDFEEFLKPFLEAIGLSEVFVTKKTGDDGVDLTAVKEGLAEINNVDSVKYRVQAKRYAPTSTISPEKIDALRGNLTFNEKGLFITTAKVSDKAKEQAVTKDPSKSVYVIDGIDLVRICIDKQIGFAYKPVFSKNALDEFTQVSKTVPPQATSNNEFLIVDYVNKTITTNDIRAHIVSVPRAIVDKITNNTVKQIFNDLNLGKINDQSIQYKAANFYFIREYCYGSMFRYNSKGEFNIPYGGMSYNRKNMQSKIDTMFNREIETLFSDTEIHCSDFEKFFDNVKLTSNDFMFLDPPYDTDFSDYEGKDFTKFDQERLAYNLRKTAAKFLLVIKNTEFIHNLYEKDFNIVSFDKQYSYNMRSRNDRDVEHLIITNLPV